MLRPFLQYSVYILLLQGPSPMVFLSLSMPWHRSKEALFFSSDLPRCIPLMLSAPPKTCEARWWRREEKRMATEKKQNRAQSLRHTTSRSLREDSQIHPAEVSRIRFVFNLWICTLTINVYHLSCSEQVYVSSNQNSLILCLVFTNCFYLPS